MFGRHMLNSRKAMMIRRYQNAYMSCQPSVAEHMWAVAKIAQGLALWEINKFGNNVDMGKLLQIAINHDLIEIETGDILSTTKDLIPELRPILVKAEECAFDNGMMLDLPMSWREDFRGYILNPKDDTIEGSIIAAADVIDTIYESATEIKLGNKEKFCDVLKNSAEWLTKSQLNSVKYFLKYSLADLGLDIYDYFGANVYAYIRSLPEFKEAL